MSDLDPRYEWTALHGWDGRIIRHTRGKCLHLETVPVGDVDLCVTCDEKVSK